MVSRGWTRRLAAALRGFVEKRLSSAGYRGLNVALGAIVIIAAAWLFGGIAEDVVTGDPLTKVDVQLAEWFHRHAIPAVTTFMLMVTHAHSMAGIVAFAIILAVVLIWKRERYWLIVLALVVPGGMLLNVATKYAFHRARPSFHDPILTLPTYSFPSGHAAAATLFYGVLAAYLVARTPSWRTRTRIVLSAFFIIFLVALSRLYLGVHYLSDVLAAFAEAVAWLAVCLTALHALDRRGP